MHRIGMRAIAILALLALASFTVGGAKTVEAEGSGATWFVVGVVALVALAALVLFLGMIPRGPDSKRD